MRLHLVALGDLHGQHIQQTKMFDNTNFPWIDDLSTDMPTIGDMLREAGYYTAYKGKWHLTKAFETVNELGSPARIFTREMEAYGFSDYFGVGDIIAHTQGGYLHDGVTDIELYDLRDDPLEMNNLASGAKPDHELVLAMNGKLDRLIGEEVGEDRGEMLPGGIDGGWEVSAETMAGF